ncbi:hypothetical protein PanWU01x14_303310, partial [Parasponia andersonii]
TFYTLPEIVVATQWAEAIKEGLDSKWNQHRGNDKKVTRRNQRQWSVQGTPHSGSLSSNSTLGGNKGSPYKEYFSCGQPGHRKKDYPPLFEERSQISHDEDIKTVKNCGPIQVPIGPVTRAQAKRFKEELNNLVQRILQ